MQSDQKRLKKFLAHLDELIHVLGRYHSNLPIQSRINQFFYMQKSEELRVLDDKIRELEERLDILREQYDLTYRELFHDWVRDVRWLKRYLDSVYGDGEVEEEKRMTIL